ncbi:MAG: phosphotransferase [Chloroflexi bacterium]|nr:phosphotransferase [Chloroflexota bacterium]
MNEPQAVSDIDRDYLSYIARRALGDDSIEVSEFGVVEEPFEFPRFGEKEFYELPFSYKSIAGEGRASVILRVMPKMDAVMMLTGDMEHRELKAFEMGLFDMVPETFSVPYVHVIHRPEREQYWAFLRDVRPQMDALGMHTKVPDETMRTILSHLAAFHARFWEKHDIIDEPWLMSLKRPVDYFYRCIVDIIDGMKEPAEPTVYITERWPWLAEGVVNLLQSLEPDTRRAIEKLYREPEDLLERIEPMPKTLCHYDFDNRNLGIEEGPDGPRTVVIDWEILGKGISSSDVVRFTAYQQPDDLDAVIDFYLDQLEAQLGDKIDREEWRLGFELGSITEWQIRGVLFGVMVSAPSAPVPDEQRPAMRERVFSDVSYVESLIRKHGLA